MSFMRSSNPALNDRTFSTFERYQAQAQANVMTVQGTVNRTAVLLVGVVLGAAWTWQLFAQRDPALMLWMYGGLIGGLVLFLVTPVWLYIEIPILLSKLRSRD